MNSKRFAHRRPSIAALTVACASLLAGTSSVLAAWNQTGPGPFEYNDGNNWAGGVIDDHFPAPLIIPQDQIITVNASRILSGDWRFLYDGPGNLNLRGGVGINVTMGGNFLLDSLTNARTVTFGGSGVAVNIDLASQARVFTVATGDTADFIHSVINGAGTGFVTLTKDGVGTMQLRGASSSFAGQIQIDAGVLETIQNIAGTVPTGNTVLGAADNDVILNGGTYRPNFSMVAAGRLGAGHAIIVNNVSGNTIDTVTRINLGAAPNQLTGPGALLKVGADALHVFAANDYSGALTVQEGLLSLRSPGALTAAAMINLTGGILTAQTAATTTFGTPVNIVASTVLTGGHSTANQAGISQTFGSLTVGGHAVTMNTVNITSGTQTMNFDGAHSLAGTPTFSINNPANATAVINLIGSVGDGGSGSGIIKEGTGRLTFSGGAGTDNTYGGQTVVNLDNLLLNKVSNTIAIPGNLTQTGGAVTFTPNRLNMIADSATLTISGGLFNGTVLGAGSQPTQDSIANLNVSSSGAFQTGAASIWTVSNAGVFTGGGGAAFVGNSGSAIIFEKLTASGFSLTSASPGGVPNSFSLFGNNTSAQTTVAVSTGGLTLDSSGIILRRGTTANTLGSRIVLGGDVSTTGAAASFITEDTAYTPVAGTVAIELSGLAGQTSRTFTVTGGGADLALAAPVLDGAQLAVDLVKAGAGTLEIASPSSYSGLTLVNAGTLLVSGSLSAALTPVNVTSGGTLGGGGIIERDVAIVGGSLSPGGTLATGSATGTLTTNSLTLDSATTVKFELTSGNTAIGGINDLVVVNGSLTLDGTLIVTELGGTLLDFSTYRLFNYTDALADIGLSIDPEFLSAHPGSTIDTSTAGQVNLVVIPEPVAALSLLAGAALLGLRRRRC